MTQPQEVLRNYQQLLSNNNNVQQTSFSSMVLNGAEVRGANNLVSKQTRYTRSKKKIINVPQAPSFAFTTFIPNEIGFPILNIAGDRDEPEPLFAQEDPSFELIDILNLKKEGDSISYDAIYEQRYAQRFFKQVGVVVDPENSDRIVGGQLINDSVSIPNAVSCTTALASEEPQSRYFIATGYDFEDNAGVVFFGETPEGIDASTIDGDEFPYYVTYEDGVPDGGFLVSRSQGLPALRNLTSAGGEFSIRRASTDGLDGLDTRSIRVSKIVDGNEESFVILPAYDSGNTIYTEYIERPITQEYSRISNTNFGGGVLGIYGDLCVFYSYEYFGVKNYESSFIFQRFIGYSDTSVRVVLGYANIRTKEIVNNHAEIELRLLSNGRDVEKEPVDYPINWDGEEPLFVETVFVLQQGFITGVLETNKVKFGFQASHIVSSEGSFILDHSTGVFSEDSEVDEEGFTIFDDAEYRLYTGNTFSVLPQDFFKLPIPLVEGTEDEDITTYFEDVLTFFSTTTSFSNGIKSYRRWLQLTDDLTLVLFVGRPTEVVEEQENIVDGIVLYLTRTIEGGFGDSFEDVAFTPLETGVQQMVNLVIEL